MYHLKLRSFVVIELKSDKFKPEYAGKMNFYLSAVDDLLKHPNDNPSIGLILCKTKNQVQAEYTLRDLSKPIGLAEYRLSEALPENFKNALPTIEELENYLKNDSGFYESPNIDFLNINHSKIRIKSATINDIDLMVKTSEIKRTKYEEAQPLFWKKSPHANENQTIYFKELLNSDKNILLIGLVRLVPNKEEKNCGFIIGQIITSPEVYNPGGYTLMVDDFCVLDPNLWNTVGKSLLEEVKAMAKIKGAVQILVVCGAHDKTKREFLFENGFGVVSEWFTQPLL